MPLRAVVAGERAQAGAQELGIQRIAQTGRAQRIQRLLHADTESLAPKRTHEIGDAHGGRVQRHLSRRP